MEILNTKVERARRLIAIISVAVSLYYLYWRVTETFNPNALVFSWTLYLAEIYGTLTTILLYFTIWKMPIRVNPPPLQNRSVDVFVPTKNESAEILRKTLIACQKLRYPHRTLLLDDGNRPEIKVLAEELGCIYLARGNNHGAKAGNLNYGLEHSTSEFIVIFDADHIPLSNFIDRTIGYMQDEKVGFVQTPQEFYNTDSFQHRTDRKNKTVWGEQYLFFSVIQPGKDYWNSAYFVGSCAILRRKALDDVGGFAEISITEDMLTSINIHSKGWSSVYHNENLAFGIAAETIVPFHIQRLRWGIGNWMIFFRANPFLVRGLTFPQRLNYFSSMVYPLEGIQKLVFYLVPPIALFTGVLPMKALDMSYLIHFVPYFLITIFAFNEMARGYGGQLMLEQQSMGKYFTYLKSLWLFMFNKSRSEFKVTPKGSANKKLVPYSVIIPQAAIFILSFLAIIFAVVAILGGLRQDNFVITVNCFWALYNSGLAMAIIQYDYKKLFQRRSSFRMPDAVLVKYIVEDEIYDLQSGTIENAIQHFAVADNITDQGISLICIGQIPTENHISMEIMIPGKTISISGTVMQLKSMPGGNQPISQLGIRFNNMSPEVSRFLTYYIHEAAVVKYMKELSNRYKTYLDRRFMVGNAELERAYRALGFLPVVQSQSGEETYCVLKDVSATGLLLATAHTIEVGNSITAEIILGSESILLKGMVVREVQRNSGEYMEHLYGVRLDEASLPEVKHIIDIANIIGGFVQG
jgi:cellulose synthase (UDP-forming)